MEAIQAAIERLNAADDIDEEELERLEAEIDRLLAAAGLKGVDDNTAVDVDEDEGDEDEREGAAAAATPDVDRRASSQGLRERARAVGALAADMEGGLAAVVERLEDVSGFFQRKPTGSDMAQQAGKATPPVKLSKAQRRTLEKLDQWAAAEGSERQGAVRAYGAAGVRADLVQSYGRLLLRSKQTAVSDSGSAKLSDLEKAVELPVRHKQTAEDGTDHLRAASHEVEALLSRIESQVGTHTTNVAQHVGGGVAAPGLAAVGLYYARQSRNVQYALLIAFVVIFVAFYFLFYEEEESLEENLEEQLQADAIGTAPSVFDGAANMTVGALVEDAADAVEEVVEAVQDELQDIAGTSAS